MGLYNKYLLPHLIHLACSSPPVRYHRRRLMPVAEGRVLEIGMGSGLNLPFYNKEKVTHLWGLEPSEGMRRKAQSLVEATGLAVNWLDLPGEQIPLENNSADTVVLTYTLCTIPGYHDALREMRRVLKPGGRLLFSEHGKAPDAAVRAWQDRLNPVWKPVAGGCNLNRDIPLLLEQGGFRVRELHADYLRKTPKFVGFNYFGYAD